jgi:hypothetical protein
MDPCRFDRLVVIEDRRRVGSRRNISSVQEAAECLVSGEWPKPRGVYYRKALRACYECLAGQIPIKPTRQAFIDAAREAGILIGEAPLRGQ